MLTHICVFELRTFCENAGLKIVAGKNGPCLTWVVHRLIQARDQQGPLLTWINFNPGMHKLSHAQ